MCVRVWLNHKNKAKTKLWLSMFTEKKNIQKIIIAIFLACKWRMN